MRTYLLSHLLSVAASRYPEREAVTDTRRCLTYAQLERESNRVARLLRDVGVRNGDRVGLFLNKSIEAVTGIYGILKAGGSYVPLDPFAPAPRLAYIARNCDLRCLVTERDQAFVWRYLLEAGVPLAHLLVLNAAQEEIDLPDPSVRGHGVEALVGASDVAPSSSSIGLDLAYILYTSGSTGQPKGVMLSHQNALAFVRWCHDYFAPTPQDVFSNHAPLHFDLTVLDIYVAAMAGAKLVLIPREISLFPVQLATLIEEEEITIWYSVPSILALLALRGKLAPGRLPSLRHVIFAGEVFPTKHLRKLMALLPQAAFTNLYGPTETNVCTYYRVPTLADDQMEPIPIGKAIDDVEVFAVTEQGQMAAPGQLGELYVRGNTVAYGYWGDQDQTRKAFLPNPFGPTTDRCYRTGDLVRQNQEGDFLFLGRRDHQIKSRGYRIEIGDIEAAIYAHPDVVECAVIPVPDEIISNRIVAFVVARTSDLTAEGLIHHCARQVPKYMVPEQFQFLSVLPRTSTGKVDRASLIAPVLTPLPT